MTSVSTPPPKRPRLFAYVDESGSKTFRDPRQRYFVMSAVVLNEEDKPKGLALLADLRKVLNRKPGTRLHWRNIRKACDKEAAARLMGGADFLTIVHVVVCHDYLLESKRILNEFVAYMWTYQFLMERLSWLARERKRNVAICVERIVRFTDFKFNALLGAIRGKKEWNAYDAHKPEDHHAESSGTKLDYVCGHRLDSPTKVELLQLADMFSSSAGAAFNLADRRWLEMTKARIWRTRKPMSTYGVKIHPWGRSPKSQNDHAWVNAY